MSSKCIFAAAFQDWQDSATATSKIDPERRTRFFFSLQSSDVTFSEWIGLLTLAITPLLAHIFVGGPV
ncbi:Nn.00g022680.m01.CDS01 [Neocucurbitaria sp. VM-36]